MMALLPLPLPQFASSSNLLQPRGNPLACSYPSLLLKYSLPKPLVVTARANTRKESAKVRNRRFQKKFNGTSARPRLSVFCSTKQLYAVLVDDRNKKCLFYASTLQKSIWDVPACSTIEAAQRVVEELVKACVNLKINEISSYDWNGFARGQRMAAFEIAISQHGFLSRQPPVKEHSQILASDVDAE